MIKFIKITSTQYAGITPNEDNFYYLTDTNEVYLGTKHLTDQDLSTYLTNVQAKDNSIVVSNNNQVGVKISSKTGNNLTLETTSGKEGLYVNVPAATDYTIAIDTTSGGAQDPYSVRYTVKQGASGSQTTIGNIDIPKDMVVEEGAVVDITYSNGKLYDGSTDVTSKIKGTGTATEADAGKYIKLTIANATSDTIYIAAKDLVDIYTAQQSATQVQLAISNSNVISATIVAGSVGTTELATGVVTSLGKADSAIQEIAEGAANGQIKYTVNGTDYTAVSVHGLGSAAYTASTAYDVAGAAAAVQGQSGDASTAVTVYGAKAYADSLASNYDAAGAANTAESNAKSYADGLLAWETYSAS